MPAIRVGVREFRERIASYLESDTPVAVTRHGETVGIYVPAPRRRRDITDAAELRAAADRLAEALSQISEEELVTEFRAARRNGRKTRSGSK